MLGERFVPQSYEGVQNFARQFAAHCEALLQSEGAALGEKVFITRTTRQLPLDQTGLEQSMEEAKSGDEAHRQWVAAITRKQCWDHETLEISRLDLGGLTMFFFNAEVAQKYAAIAREQVPGALSAGYCNGMIGYLATAQMCIRDSPGSKQASTNSLQSGLRRTYSSAPSGETVTILPRLSSQRPKM